MKHVRRLEAKEIFVVIAFAYLLRANLLKKKTAHKSKGKNCYYKMKID